MDEFEELTEEQATGPVIAEPEVTEAQDSDSSMGDFESLDSSLSSAESVARAPNPAPARRSLAELVAARKREQLALQARFETEFANIRKGAPKARATNAATIESIRNSDAKEARIQEILAKRRAEYVAKKGRKTVRKMNIFAGSTRRNAPSILSATRNEAKRIRDEAKRALMELKVRAEGELRAVGANISVLHPVFHSTRRKPGPSKTKI